MRLNLLCIGKTDDALIRTQLDYYIHRLPRHWNFQITEISDIKNTKNLTPQQIKQQEAKLFLPHIEAADWVVLLDEKGKQYTSRAFSDKIQDWELSSLKKIHFLIGGAWGVGDEILHRANEKMALSTMTFTHQMIRLFIIEQIYRAAQILQGKPYHND